MTHIDLSKLSFSTDVKTEHIVLLPDQGFSNENYTFTIENKAYLLRKFKLQDRDREWEYKVQSLAYENGLAAKPLHLDLSQGFMVCEFLEGEHKQTLHNADLSLFASQVKKLHALKCESPTLELEAMFVTCSVEVENAFETIKRFPKEIVLCHNDLNPKNCIFSAEGLKFIDWEFAGMNDRYFDLAAVCVEFELDDEMQELFLEAYFENEYNVKKLEAYKIIYKTLCEEWFQKNL